MSAFKKLLVVSVVLLLSLCGYATISQADTTEAYYQKRWKITDISLGDNLRFVEITATDWHNNKKKLTLYRPTM